MLVRLRARLVCLGLSSAFLVSSPALARGLSTQDTLRHALPALAWATGDDEITPESANTARFGFEQQGKQLSDAGAHDQAAELYWTKGIELKDPVLIIDAAEAWRDLAAAQRSVEAAQTAIDRVQLALDMLYFLRDGAASANWQPVAPAYVGVVIERALAVVTDAEALISAIEAEQQAAAQAAAEPAEAPRERGPAKPGTALIAGGSAALVVGIGGGALGIAGLVLGARAQSEVEDPTVYEPEHSAAEARGRNANVLAGVGLALAGVGIGVGAALIVLGLKQRRAAGAQASAQVTPMFMSGFGLSVRGSF